MPAREIRSREDEGTRIGTHRVRLLRRPAGGKEHARSGQDDSDEGHQEEDRDGNVWKIRAERQSRKETGGQRKEQRILPETRTDHPGQLVGH